jgi:hypothetical protein
MSRTRGKVNLIGLAILAVAIYGVWWLINHANAYLDNSTVKDAVQAAYNTSAREYRDAELYHLILQRVNATTVGDHYEDDGFGNVRLEKGLGIKDDDINISRDEIRKTIHIEVNYDRVITVWPTGKKKKIHFRVVKDGPIPAP